MRSVIDMSGVAVVPGLPAGAAARRDRLEAAGGHVLRYGLVGILLYLGAFKFTAVEAAAIAPLVGSSPLMGWLYAVLSEQDVFLLGAALWSAGEARQAARERAS